MASYLHPVSRLVRLMPLLYSFAVLTPLALPPTQLLAQQQTQRTVQGKVVNSSGAGLKNATIFLKDTHTLSIKSYITSDDGSFRFGQLLPSTDYELWAEFDSKKSPVKNISSFDTRAEFNLTLKIDTK